MDKKDDNNINTSSVDATFDKLEQENNELLEKLEEFEKGWKRALADYQNLEKRFNEEKEVITLRANEVLIDKLTHVLAHLENLDKYFNDEGLHLILNEFKYILEEAGLEELIPESKEFDHSHMEAIESVPGEKNKVVEVLQKGYMFNGTLLRPARVNVGNGEPPSKEKQKENNPESIEEQTKKN